MNIKAIGPQQAPTISTSERAQLRKATQEFESMFLNIVLKSMRDSVQKSGFIDGGNAEEIYKSMLDQEYAKSLAEQGSTGLAAAMERQLLERFGKDESTGVEAKFVKKQGIDSYRAVNASNPSPKGISQDIGQAAEPLQAAGKQARMNLMTP